MRRKKYMTRKEINEMRKRWREALTTPTKPLHDPVPLGEIMDAHLDLEGKEICEDCISRAEAIRALEYDLSIEADGGLDKYRTVIKDLLNAIYNTQKKAIEALPSIQSKPKTGEWIETTVRGSKSLVCSKCGADLGSICETNFCPDCGADMRGESNETDY